MATALVVAVVIVALYGLQRRLIYFPTQTVGDPPAGVTEVTVTTGDEVSLRGWLVPAATPAAPLVLVFQGNGGSWADRLPLAQALAGEGMTVVLAGYRGYGGNPGSPSEAGLYADARAWVAWAEDAHDGPIAYYGESIGTAVAVRMAVERPPSALVLRSPFTSLSDVAGVHYPWLPVGRLLQDRYETLDRMGAIEVPVLVIIGTADDLVPPAQSRRVHEAAGGPATLLEVPGAGHNDRTLLDGEEMITAIATFLLTG